jgi:hypothetical protein
MKFFTFCSLLLLALSSQAQSYSFIKTLSEDIWRIVPAQNGTFYSITWTPDCPDDLITISFFNEKGEIQNTFQSPPYIGSLTSIDGVVNSNNHLVLYLGDGDINHLIYEFDANGNFIWNNSLQFTSPIIKFTKIITSPTGYYLLGNTYAATGTDSSFAVLTKLSMIGKHQWTKKYGVPRTSTASTHFNDILYHNNALICVGRYYYANQWAGQGPMRPTVSVLDTAGNLMQNYCYVVDSSAFFGFDYYEFVQISKTPNNHFYLVGNNGGNEHALFKMNSNYNIQWIRERLSGKSNAMCAGYNEDVFIVPDGPTDNFVQSFDSTGQVTGNHITKNPSSGFNLSYGKVVSIKQHDCGFLLINNDAMYAHVNKNFVYCLDSSKTSNIGNYYPVNNYYRRTISLFSAPLTNLNQYVITSGYGNISKTAVTHGIISYTCSSTMATTNPSQENLKVYPNPSNSVIYVELSQNYRNAKIALYEPTGKLVLSEVATETGLHSLDISKVSAGVYLLCVQQGEEIFTQKVQVVK